MNPNRRQREHAPRGLYLVTPDDADCGRLSARVAPLLPFATWLQYRNKAADAGLRGRQAAALQALCATAGVALIVNDDPALAAAVGAAGVHLGEDDGGIAAARALLGPDAIIGVSCYDEFERAERYAEVADNLAFGSLFGSSTKPGAVRAPLELLTRAKARGWNVVGIGGVEASNARKAIEAGADAVAVITGVFRTYVHDTDAVFQAAGILAASIRG